MTTSRPMTTLPKKHLNNSTSATTRSKTIAHLLTLASVVGSAVGADSLVTLSDSAEKSSFRYECYQPG